MSHPAPAFSNLVRRFPRSFATATFTLAAGLLAAPSWASEVGYDATLGDIHTQVTYSYNITWDESYGGFPGQPSQLVMHGQEVIDQLDPSAFVDEEWQYLQALLNTDGSRAVMIEDPWEVNAKIYVPMPSHSEPSLAIPEHWQHRKGIWVRTGFPEPQCGWIFNSRGEQGTSTGCYCIGFYEQCCDGECHFRSFCQTCYTTGQGHLEGLYGPSPRWQNPRPFAEIEPGQRLEIEADLLD
ncbi:MAG: hypothetical protein AAGM22_01335 [Acidobacteriota bacterium]